MADDEATTIEDVTERHAMDGAASFTDFRNRLGISRNILSDRLRRLVEQDVLTAVVAPSGKRRVYTLTDAGRDLFTTIVALRQWGERHTFADDEPRSTLTDQDGHPVAQMHPRTRAGELLTLDLTRVRRP